MKRIGLLCLFVIMLIAGFLFISSVEGSASWWDKFGKPEYGGEINFIVTMIEPNFDAHDPRGNMPNQYDGLFFYDWTVDPDIHPYKNEFVTAEYYKGFLAESWEQSDPTTVTIHLRQGVHWQNKPPVNGREFTADDVVYNFDRILGTGNGFTEPNPFISNAFPNIERAVAKDKYTVQFKLKNPLNYWSIYQIMTSTAPSNLLGMVAKEWVDQGDLKNYKNSVGTGPWIVTDFTDRSMLSFVRNPDYWGYDERYPDNRLPYADKLKLIMILEKSTALAALRTGKADIFTDMMNYPSWQEVASVKKTNPDILSGTQPAEGYSVEMRVDKKPFTDIKVRKALQMAINRKEIVEGYFGNTIDWKPCGLMHPVNKDWVTPYDQWPDDLKQEYSYNPEKAKELLAEAGYPDGFDTVCVMSNQSDQRLLEIIQSQFREIGVDMQIEVFDNPTFIGYCASGKNEQMDYFSTTGKYMGNPIAIMAARTIGEFGNFTGVNDPAYQALYQKILDAKDVTEAQAFVKEADLYVLRHHWAVNTIPFQGNVLWQPYFKAYDCQAIGGGSPWLARIWIDQAMKKSMY